MKNFLFLFISLMLFIYSCSSSDDDTTPPPNFVQTPEPTTPTQYTLTVSSEDGGSVSTEGKVVLGRQGVIEGDVVCGDADISGTIKAKITVSKLLSLKTTAKLSGDIITNKLSIEPGASFTGSCSMGAVIKDLNEPAKTEKKTKTA